MVVVGSERRAARRTQRTVEELDADGRRRLRALLTNSCLVIVPTSSAVELVTSRLAPGSVTIGVASTSSLGIDQTVGVTEILAARGFDVRPHLAPALVGGPGHLSRITRRLLACRSVLLVPGPDGLTAGALLRDTAGALAEAAGALRIGIEVEPAPGEANAEAVMAAAESADWISTAPTVDARRLTGWAAEMRVRGLETPIELGIPGVVPSDALARSLPQVAAAVRSGWRANRWHEPTDVVVNIARERSLDRLGIVALRIETLNFVDETAGWRQRLFDLAGRVGSI